MIITYAGFKDIQLNSINSIKIEIIKDNEINLKLSLINSQTGQRIDTITNNNKPIELKSKGFDLLRIYNNSSNEIEIELILK